MRPAFLGALAWLVAIGLLYPMSRGVLTLRAFRELMRGPNAELDEGYACDLVTDFIAAPRAGVKVQCRGSLSIIGNAARLSGVVMNGSPSTYCLARAGETWLVLRAAGGVPCFATPPPDLSRPLASERERVEAEAKQVFEARMRVISATLASGAPVPERCSDRVWSAVPVLDFELLTSTVPPGWEFLTTRWLSQALASGRVVDAVSRWPRPWVAILRVGQRTPARLPSVLEPGWSPFAFQPGSLAGTLLLMNAETGELLCAHPVSVRSSERLPSIKRASKFDLPGLDAPTPERVELDFQTNYRAELNGVLAKMTGYRVTPAPE